MPDNKSKFLFDLNNFDTDAQEEKQKKPKEPTFSIKDMEEARSTAFETGKTEGMQLAKESLEQRTEIVVQSLAQNISALERQEQQRHDETIQDALIITYKALKTLIPSLWEKITENDIKRFLQDFLSQTISKSGLTLFVHPSIVEKIELYIQKTHTDITVKTDDQLSPNASRIEWVQGSATFTPEQTAEKILQLIYEQINDPSELLDESTKKTHNEDTRKDLEKAPEDE